MDDKYFDELLAIQTHIPGNFVAMEKSKLYVTIDQRDLFEEMLINRSDSKAEGQSPCY